MKLCNWFQLIANITCAYIKLKSPVQTKKASDRGEGGWVKTTCGFIIPHEIYDDDWWFSLSLYSANILNFYFPIYTLFKLYFSNMLLFFRLGTEMYILHTKHLNKANLLAMNHHQHRHSHRSHCGSLRTCATFLFGYCKHRPKYSEQRTSGRGFTLRYSDMAAHHYALSIRKQAIIVFGNFQLKWYMYVDSCVLFHSQ